MNIYHYLICLIVSFLSLLGNLNAMEENSKLKRKFEDFASEDSDRSIEFGEIRDSKKRRRRKKHPTLINGIFAVNDNNKNNNDLFEEKHDEITSKVKDKFRLTNKNISDLCSEYLKKKNKKDKTQPVKRRTILLNKSGKEKNKLN